MPKQTIKLDDIASNQIGEASTMRVIDAFRNAGVSAQINFGTLAIGGHVCFNVGATLDFSKHTQITELAKQTLAGTALEAHATFG